jgi:hypothetical protein
LNAVRNLASIRPRAEYWAPSKRVRNAVEALQAQRLGIAGEVAAEFTFALPKGQRKWDAAQMNYATLFLIDSLAGALAFDAAELMDSQREWLTEAMPPRSVMPELIDRHLRIFERVLSKTFTNGQMRLFEPLIERVKDSS